MLYSETVALATWKCTVSAQPTSFAQAVALSSSCVKFNISYMFTCTYLVHVVILRTHLLNIHLFTPLLYSHPASSAIVTVHLSRARHHHWIVSGHDSSKCQGTRIVIRTHAHRSSGVLALNLYDTCLCHSAQNIGHKRLQATNSHAC